MCALENIFIYSKVLGNDMFYLVLCVMELLGFCLVLYFYLIFVNVDTPKITDVCNVCIAFRCISL